MPFALAFFAVNIFFRLNTKAHLCLQTQLDPLLRESGKTLLTQDADAAIEMMTGMRMNNDWTLLQVQKAKKERRVALLWSRSGYCSSPSVSISRAGYLLQR
jgi:hypothetical protein